MESKEKKKKDDWIRMTSKSRPGRFYMFNKSTGETQWLNEEKQTKQQKQESPPKLSINKASKTPAQDRLKRLQHNLKVRQTRSHTSRVFSESESKIKPEPGNLNQDKPSTSSSANVTTKSPKKATKRPIDSRISNELENSLKRVKSPTMSEAKILSLSESSNNNFTPAIVSESVTTEVAAEVPKSSKSITANNSVEHILNPEEHNSSSLNNIRKGIVKKIKQICKMPFNMSKKIADEKLSAKEEKSHTSINTTQFKPTKKTKDNKLRLSSSVALDVISLLSEENSPSPSVKIAKNCSEPCTPRNINIPTYPRGSANSRLERLKQSLLSQQQSCQSKTSETSYNNIISLQSEDKDNARNNNSTAYNIPNEDIEAMDWQPIAKDEELIEISCDKPSVLVTEKYNKISLPTIDTKEIKTMGDIYDTVNENLLRFSAEKQNDSANNKKWRKDFYYFIADTNVLLRDLTFVEDLTKLKLCDTNGSMLYIPYSVLQELDKLKMRSGRQEGIKTLAVRCIKYLNSKFESNSSHLQAQSALEERDRLVDINSADDSIINCCLQAKKHVPNLILLTEDVNLRNKAICNNICVSTKSDLLSKRYDSEDKS